MCEGVEGPTSGVRKCHPSDRLLRSYEGVGDVWRKGRTLRDISPLSKLA